MKANQDAYSKQQEGQPLNDNYAVQLFRESEQKWVDLCYCESVNEVIIAAEKENLNWNVPSRAISKRTNTVLAEFKQSNKLRRIKNDVQKIKKSLVTWLCKLCS